MEVIFMRGLSASGKSTWARAWVAENPDNRARVNMDDIRATIGAPFSPGSEKLALKAQDHLFVSALKAGRSVVVDNTHVSGPTWPRRLALLAWEAGIHPTYRIHDMDTSLFDCLARDAHRGEVGVGSAVIHKQERQRKSARGQWTLDDILVDLEPIVPLVHDPKLPWCIVSDLDGTLCNSDGIRSPLHEPHRCEEDALHVDVANILASVFDERMAGQATVLLFSGREDAFRPETTRWLKDNGIAHDALFMRAAGDNRRDSIVKAEMVERYIRGRYNVFVWLDDRSRVVNTIRQFGIRVLQVAGGDF